MKNIVLSVSSHRQRQACGEPPGVLVGQRLRSTVICDDCHKPQGFYAKHILSVKEKKELEALKEMVHYTCGAPITTEHNVLHGTVFVATNLHCYDHVEFAANNHMFAAIVQHHKHHMNNKHC